MAIIALLTDFGLRDHYVGAMKGAMLRVAPEATLVDIVHELPPQDVLAGALALEGAYSCFPPGTVFAAVVDPGVGSERRAIAAAAGGWTFVAPDNGLLTFVLEAHPAAHVHLLANPQLRREPVSPVFHGRDVFGPAAAHLARGLPIDAVGPIVTDAVRLAVSAPARVPDGLRGTVLRCDRFGNLTTNLREADLAAVGGPDLAGLEVALGGRVVRFVRTYSDASAGEPCALLGSSGRLEIAVARGRGDALPEGKVGARVVVRTLR